MKSKQLTDTMYRHILYLLTATLWTATVCGQTTFSSVEQVWEYADAHSVAISNAALELKKGTAGETQSKLDFLPAITGTGTFTDNTTLQTTLIPAAIAGGPADTYVPVKFGQQFIYNGGVAAQMDIVNIQKWYNLRIARETATMNRAAMANTRKTIYQQAAACYYACVLNTEAMRLARRSAAVADSVLTTSNNKFAEGTINQATLDAAQLNSERAQQTLINATYQLQTSQNALKSLLGLSVEDSLNVAGDTQPAADAPHEPFATDPSVQLANEQVRLNYDKLGHSRAGIYPTLSLAYNNSQQHYDNTFRPFDAPGPQWFKATYWSVRLNWNIFTGGNRWLQNQRNKLTYLQSEADAAQTRRQSAINDENLRLSYQKAASLLTRASNIMRLSYDSYHHTTLRYDEGMASLEDRLRAFSDYLNYQNQYLNALSEMLIQSYNVKLRQQTF